MKGIPRLRGGSVARAALAAVFLVWAGACLLAWSGLLARWYRPEWFREGATVLAACVAVAAFLLALLGPHWMSPLLRSASVTSAASGTIGLLLAGASGASFPIAGAPFEELWVISLVLSTLTLAVVLAFLAIAFVRRTRIRAQLSTVRGAYDAFIAYSRRDESLAAAIQRAIERMGLDLSQPTTTRVFRDVWHLGTGDARRALYRALEVSTHLILIGSDASRESRWVNEELEHWLREGGDQNRLHLVAASGSAPWDDTGDRVRSDSFSEAVVDCFGQTVPSYVDVRETASFAQRVLRYTKWVKSCAGLVEAVRPTEPLKSEVIHGQLRLVRQRALGIFSFLFVLVLVYLLPRLASGLDRPALSQPERPAGVGARAEYRLRNALHSDGPSPATMLELWQIWQHRPPPLLRLDGFVAQPRAVAIDRRRSRLAVGRADGRVELRDLFTGAPIRTLVVGDQSIRLLKFSQDATRLFVATDRRLSILETGDGGEFCRLDLPADYGRPASIDVGADGELWFAGGRHRGRVSADCKLEAEQENSSVLAYSPWPQGSLVAVWKGDPRILARGQVRRPGRGPQIRHSISAAVVRGREVLWASADGQLFRWNGKDAEPPEDVADLEGTARALEVDGESVVAHLLDGRIWVWNGKETYTRDGAPIPDDAPGAIAVDGGLVVQLSYGGVELWSPQVWEAPLRHLRQAGHFTAVIANDGDLAAVGTGQDPAVTVWALESAKPVFSINDPMDARGAAWSLAFLPDVSGNSGVLFVGGGWGSVERYDLGPSGGATRRWLSRPLRQTRDLSVVYRPDPLIVAVGGAPEGGHQIQWLSPDDGTVVDATGGEGWPFSVAAPVDGRWIAVAERVANKMVMTVFSGGTRTCEIELASEHIATDPGGSQIFASIREASGGDAIVTVEPESCTVKDRLVKAQEVGTVAALAANGTGSLVVAGTMDGRLQFIQTDLRPPLIGEIDAGIRAGALAVHGDLEGQLRIVVGDRDERWSLDHRDARRLYLWDFSVVARQLSFEKTLRDLRPRLAAKSDGGPVDLAALRHFADYYRFRGHREICEELGKAWGVEVCQTV